VKKHAERLAPILLAQSYPSLPLPYAEKLAQSYPSLPSPYAEKYLKIAKVCVFRNCFIGNLINMKFYLAVVLLELVAIDFRGSVAY